VSTFEKTICRTFGLQGQKWLAALPTIIDELKEQWALSDIAPVSNMSYHYVAKATRISGEPVVIKIGCDRQLIQNEAFFLQANNSGKMVHLLDYNLELCALLMTQAQPGTSIKEIYPQEINTVMQTFANLTHGLHQYGQTGRYDYPHVSKWLEAIDHASLTPKTNKLFSIAKTKKNALLSSMGASKLLHGDLHLDNIIKQGKSWVCIDPKGLWGELEFEIAAFDIFAPSEVKTATNETFLSRIDCLAHLMHVQSERLKDWFFVRLALSAAWTIEDNGDPSNTLRLVSLIND